MTEQGSYLTDSLFLMPPLLLSVAESLMTNLHEHDRPNVTKSP